MTLAAMIYVDQDAGMQADDRRIAPRRAVGQETTLRRQGAPVHAVLHNLSSTGASVETAVPLVPGSTVTIGLAGAGRFAATVVSANGLRYGCMFAQPLPDGALHDAFATDSVVVGPFGGAQTTRYFPSAPVKYPGIVRLALPVAGAVGGWTVVAYAARAVLG
jgi:hypothetical protein